MPSITVTQLNDLRQQITSLSAGNSADVNATLSNVYGTLQAAGFTYAGWAKGVVEQNTISGVSAMVYLDSSTGRSLTQTQIKVKCA